MPSIYENLHQTMTSDVIEPAQRGVDALDAAQHALALSQGLIEGVVGTEVNSNLQHSAISLAQANQMVADALGLLAQISSKTNSLMSTVGLEVPQLHIPAQAPVTPIRLSNGNIITAPGVAVGEHVGDGPLDIIRSILTTHTDRNPADNTAITAMMRYALDELGADHGAFSDELINVLDPHTEQTVSAHTVATISGLGELIANESMPRAARWGALSLIGTVALAESATQTNAEEAVSDSAMHTFLIRHVARQALQTIVESDLDEPYRTSAHVLMTQEGFSVEDVAVDLELGGFRESGQKLVGSLSASESDEDILKEAQTIGASIGNIYEAPIFSLGADVRAKIEAMDWLSLDDNTVGSVRDISHDGAVIARVVDLTANHPMLAFLKDKLENSHKLGQSLWQQMAVTVSHFNQGRKLKRIQLAKAPMFSASNNDIRINYTPLGRDMEGITILGLVALYTKTDQRQVFRIVTKNTSGHQRGKTHSN